MSAGFALPEELTIYTVGEWQPRCVAWAAGDSADVLHVDAAAVQEVDGAGLQLLLALANALAQRGRRLVLDAPSAPLAGACAALGLTQLLAEPAAETA